MDLFSAYAVNALAGDYTEANLEGENIHFVWATAANAQPTAFFKVKFTVKSDVAFGKYDVDASIAEFYHGENRAAYVAGTDYVVAAEHLGLEVYCDHVYKYTKPAGTPAQADAKHTVTCEKCTEYVEILPCEFGAPVVVVPDECDSVGTSKIVCEHCKYEISYDVDEIKDHKWSAKWYVDGTTPEDASRHYQKCENDDCDARNYADCSSLTWNNVATANGSKHICDDCGREMACIWQTYGEEHGATCTEDAYTVYSCIKLCGGKYTAVHAGTATGHNIVKNPDGVTHSCTKCDEIKNVACSFTKNIQTGDSCMKDDIKECICGNRKVIAAPGFHAEEKKVIMYKAPTERASGYIQLTCTACNTKLAYDMNKNLTKGVQFNDINDWYKDTAIFAKSFNLMGGDANGNFDGNGKLTRGMVVTVLGRYMWGYLEQMSEREFNALLDQLEAETGNEAVELKDLKGDWYDRYAIALSTIGVVKGSYGNFNPLSSITRGEMVTVLARIGFTQDYIDSMSDYAFEEFLADLALEYGTTPVEFTDVEGKFYERHARILSALGVVNGYANNLFKGEANITREELAAVLVRFLDLFGAVGIGFDEPVDSFTDVDKVSDWAVEYVEAVREMGIFKGDGGKFKPQSNANRSEVAQTLYRMGCYEGILLYLGN